MNYIDLLAINNGKEIYIVVDSISQVDNIMHKYNIPGLWGTLHKTVSTNFVWPITLKLNVYLSNAYQCTWEPDIQYGVNPFDGNYILTNDTEMQRTIRQIRDEIYGTSAAKQKEHSPQEGTPYKFLTRHT